MKIINQLKAIRKVALANIHKSPAYFATLVQEIDVKLFELESEKEPEVMEVEDSIFEPFSMKEVS